MINQIAENLAGSLIRGFDVRIMFAQAVILKITDPEAAAEIEREAVERADMLGYMESDSGATVPVMFEDVPVLSQAWKVGFQAGRSAD